MIKATTILGRTELMALGSEEFIFVDACAIINAIYNSAKEKGYGENFKFAFEAVVKSGQIWDLKEDKIPPQVQDIIDKTMKGEDGNDKD